MSNNPKPLSEQEKIDEKAWEDFASSVDDLIFSIRALPITPLGRNALRIQLRAVVDMTEFLEGS